MGLGFFGSMFLGTTHFGLYNGVVESLYLTDGVGIRKNKFETIKSSDFKKNQFFRWSWKLFIRSRRRAASTKSRSFAAASIAFRVSRICF